MSGVPGFEVLNQGASIPDALKYSIQNSNNNDVRQDALDEKQREFAIRQQELNQNRANLGMEYIAKNYPTGMYDTGIPAIDNVFHDNLYKVQADAARQLQNGTTIEEVIPQVLAKTAKLANLHSYATGMYNQIQGGINEVAPKINGNKAAMMQNATHDVIGSLIDPQTKDFRDPSTIDNQSILNDWGKKLNDPNYLSNFVMDTKPLEDEVKNPKNAAPVSVFSGNPENYTHYKGNLPIWKQLNYNPNSDVNQKGFLTNGQRPAMNIKATPIIDDKYFPSSTPDNPFMALDENAYNSLVPDVNKQAIVYAAAKKNWGNAWNNFSDKEKQLASRNWYYNNIKANDNSDFLAENNVGRPHTTNNINIGAYQKESNKLEPVKNLIDVTGNENSSLRNNLPDVTIGAQTYKNATPLFDGLAIGTKAIKGQVYKNPDNNQYVTIPQGETVPDNYIDQNKSAVIDKKTFLNGVYVSPGQKGAVISFPTQEDANNVMGSGVKGKKVDDGYNVFIDNPDDLNKVVNAMRKSNNLNNAEENQLQQLSHLKFGVKNPNSNGNTNQEILKLGRVR